MNDERGPQEREGFLLSEWQPAQLGEAFGKKAPQRVPNPLAHLSRGGHPPVRSTHSNMIRLRQTSFGSALRAEIQASSATPSAGDSQMHDDVLFMSPIQMSTGLCEPLVRTGTMERPRQIVPHAGRLSLNAVAAWSGPITKP